MPRISSLPDFRQEMIQAFTVYGRIDQLIIENLDPHAWRARPAGRNPRTIAAIFAHVHNIRRKWIRLSAPHLKLPEALDRARCTQSQARAALARSTQQCLKLLNEGLGPEDKQVKLFRRDGWARPWPAGVAMFAYMITHEAHHRGQVCLLAHQLGYPLPRKTAWGMWCWEKLWRDCGFDSLR